MLLDVTWLRKTAVKLMPNFVGMMARPRFVHRFCLNQSKTPKFSYFFSFYLSQRYTLTHN